ncbi:response regulator [Fulvivirga lutimaris]|uniref:response regulator n=1 Tax=Fulvivirga lutimaris TaxID=1819566 RepID=UPI0012BCFE47|nr:response regulator [Fulvivirga lutimaris]MTI37918.1 response regulator [Fulvivirga lutimaris]
MKPIILVIEDDEPLGWLIEKVLNNDFNVTIKREGVTAMEWLLEGNIPELILCDFVLPKISGLDFLQNLTKSGVFKEIPVIMYTSHVDEQLKQNCFEAGALEVIEKPFDPPKLIKTINEIIKAENNVKY